MMVQLSEGRRYVCPFVILTLRTNWKVEMTQYFSDRELGERPQTETEISPEALKGVFWLLQERVRNGSFGQRFPATCSLVGACCGVNVPAFDVAIKSHIPELANMDRSWSRGNRWMGIHSQGSGKWLWDVVMTEDVELPPVTAIMDVIEFCWHSVGKPDDVPYATYCDHSHMVFDRRAGQVEFEKEINRIFQRNRMAYHLTEEGRVERLIPGPVGSALRSAVLQTGDAQLDRLLETARRKILAPDENEHWDALEKLWDAWERLKTIEDSKKAKGAAIMLDKSAGTSQPKFRNFLQSLCRRADDISTIAGLTRDGCACRWNRVQSANDRYARASKVSGPTVQPSSGRETFGAGRA